MNEPTKDTAYLWSVVEKLQEQVRTLAVEVDRLGRALKTQTDPRLYSKNDYL